MWPSLGMVRHPATHLGRGVLGVRAALGGPRVRRSRVAAGRRVTGRLGRRLARRTLERACGLRRPVGVFARAVRALARGTTAARGARRGCGLPRRGGAGLGGRGGGGGGALRAVGGRGRAARAEEDGGGGGGGAHARGVLPGLAPLALEHALAVVRGRAARARYHPALADVRLLARLRGAGHVGPWGPACGEGAAAWYDAYKRKARVCIEAARCCASANTAHWRHPLSTPRLLSQCGRDA